MSDAATHAAARRLQRLRAYGLSIEAQLDAAQPSRAGPDWTSDRIAQSTERTLRALAHPPRDAMLAPWVHAALLIGEFDSARAWVANAAPSDTRTLLDAACHAFIGSPAADRDASPPTPEAMMARVQAAAAVADADDEIAVCAFVALVCALIGPQPDAARARLTLHVELPAGWQSCTVRNLRMGDAAFDAKLERRGQALRIDVEQTEGAMPATLILQATLRAPIAAVQVDGRPADLALRPAADHVVVPVQLVLDAPRTVVITLQEA